MSLTINIPSIHIIYHPIRKKKYIYYQLICMYKSKIWSDQLYRYKHLIEILRELKVYHNNIKLLSLYTFNIFRTNDYISKIKKRKKRLEEYFNNLIKLLDGNYDQLLSLLLNSQKYRLINILQPSDMSYKLSYWKKNNENTIINIDLPWAFNNIEKNNICTLFSKGDSIETVYKRYKEYVNFSNWVLYKSDKIPDIDDAIFFLETYRRINKFTIPSSLKKRYSIQPYKYNLMSEYIRDKYFIMNKDSINFLSLKLNDNRKNLFYFKINYNNYFETFFIILIYYN